MYVCMYVCTYYKQIQITLPYIPYFPTCWYTNDEITSVSKSDKIQNRIIAQ